MINIIFLILISLGTLVFPVDIYGLPAIISIFFIFFIKSTKMLNMKEYLIKTIIPTFLTIFIFFFLIKTLDKNLYIYLLNIPLIFLVINSFFISSKNYLILIFNFIGLLIINTLFYFQFQNINIKTFILYVLMLLIINAIIYFKTSFKNSINNKIFFINFIIPIILHFTFYFIYSNFLIYNLNHLSERQSAVPFICQNYISDCNLYETLFTGKFLLNNVDFNLFYNYLLAFFMEIMVLNSFINFLILRHNNIKERNYNGKC